METDGPGTLITPRPDVPRILQERCSGCGRCVAACRLRLITLDPTGHRKTARIRFPERCTRCGLCQESCPLKAITADE